jgi:REP element-mobilizing transposase RayT
VERLRELDSVFAVDVCAYAIMSNHSHLVLRLDPEQAERWSDTEVIDRWRRLFSLPVLVQRFDRGETKSAAEDRQARKIIAEWRTRLSDLSWFMRCLNEPIARQANAEDGCTGRFWEGRFKSQALLDEAALLTLMAYVDLNPIRAGMSETPEASDHTSVQQRIRAVCRTDSSDALATTPKLLPFAGPEHRDAPDALPFRLDDYLELVDWSGRVVREDKKGAIPEGIPPILERLAIDPEAWVKAITRGRRLKFHSAVGRPAAIRDAATTCGKTFFKGLKQAFQLFPEPG